MVMNEVVLCHFVCIVAYEARIRSTSAIWYGYGDN